MESKYLYFWVDFFTIIFPFALSFLPINPVYKKWKAIFPAVFLPGILFLAWDVWYTSMGVWGFNPSYVMGIIIYGLPIEEVFFFVCIPAACIFSYEAVNFFFKKDILAKIQKHISIAVCILSGVILFLNYERAYPALTFTGLLIALLFVQWIWKPDFLGRFYLTYAFILVPFLIVNGILTGTGIQEPVVWYNNDENLGVRLGTIPVEDVFYGMLLILLNISIFEFLQKRKAPRANP
jgi:lycopene cyclase domain-containing protein